MAVSSFKDVNWGVSEQLETSKLNTMAANTRFLLERAPTIMFNAYDVQKDSGIKLSCGTLIIPANPLSYMYSRVDFGSYFTVGCRPVITLGMHAAGQARLTYSFRGYDNAATPPDHRGFGVAVTSVETAASVNHILVTSYLHWMALGW